jgi:diguanylate cyclase (GGDEF)-like protein
MLKQVDVLKYKLIGILNEENIKESFILDELEKVYKEADEMERRNFYHELLLLLTHLEFPEEEAKEHWQKILEHYYTLKDLIKREMSLRVALLDYFTREYKMLKNPIIIEIFLYEITEKKAMIDEMTGLYNFRYLQKALETEYKRSQRYKFDFSVAFMDLDNLKEINDTYGHSTGDAVLKEIARIIKIYKRTEDIACRYGGDEFVCLLPQTDKEGAYICIDRIMEKVRTAFENKPYRISMSAGIASYVEDTNDAFQVLDMADKALYQAKCDGKNRVVLWNAE